MEKGKAPWLDRLAEWLDGPASCSAALIVLFMMLVIIAVVARLIMGG